MRGFLQKPVHPVFLHTFAVTCIIYERFPILVENAKALSERTKMRQVAEQDDWKDTGACGRPEEIGVLQKYSAVGK